MLLPKIEDLKRALLRFESDYELVPMHDCTVGLDRPPDNVIGILEVYNDDLWRRVLIELLTDADVIVRFKSLESLSTVFFR